MSRADLIVNLVRAGTQGDQGLFRSTVEAMAAEERAKHHYQLAERLEENLREANTRPKPAEVVRSFDGGHGGLLYEIEMCIRDRYAGAKLPAHGADSACQWCEMSGLCRRDFVQIMKS